ncbi:glycosyltransferase family 2 protein [Larkinella sp. VNQ87]|uniref:glycosyltransferase family 2 protein n=1 Tax=Larkinella sp. VNQ87 TaxID=3400921 RepID=UPI003C02007A
MPVSRVPDRPPSVLPLPNQLDRPLWSVMIPTYNCSEFLKETLESVLYQAMDPDVMQIEVVDDASTDADVEAIVNTIGKGRIKYFRQPENRGSLRNFETCLNRAQGHLVHLLHGDDRIGDNFYSKFTNLFQRFPEAGAAFCNYYTINPEGRRVGVGKIQAEKEGIIDDFFLQIAHYQRIQYVAMVVKRSVYEHLGAFYGVTYGEDWEMWARIAKHYSICYTPQVLAEYRFHNKSISSQKFSSGQVLEDLSVVINTISHSVPDKNKKKFWYKSMEHYTRFHLQIIFNIWQIDGNLTYLITQIRKTLKLYSSVFIFFFIVKLFIKKGVKKLLSPLKIGKTVRTTGKMSSREIEQLSYLKLKDDCHEEN